MPVLYGVTATGLGWFALLIAFGRRSLGPGRHLPLVVGAKAAGVILLYYLVLDPWWRAFHSGPGQGAGERAADVLRTRGFRVSVVGDHPYPGVPGGIVLRQNPQAGFHIAPGEAISIEVSR